MSSDDPHSIAMPYEDNPPVQTLDLSDGLIAGGVVVMAGQFPVEHETLPGLIFRFAKPDGSGFYPPMVLIEPPEDLAAVKPLVFRAVNAAVRAARETNAR